MKTMLFLLFGLLGFLNSAHAALNDLGNGLVNDTTLNITWMKDANLFKTLCDANYPIATDFTPVDSADAATICAKNGRMSWNDAEAWIAVLNTQNYLDHADWRLPTTPQPDLTCESTFAPDNNGGYNCRGSELGHLFNATSPAGLGNPNYAGTGTGLDGSTGTVGTRCSNCFTNTVPFDNTQSLTYWSGSDYAPNAAYAWYFLARDGNQRFVNKDGIGSVFVWPVRSGQSVIVPQQISTLSLWGLGLMNLLLVFVAQRKAR